MDSRIVRAEQAVRQVRPRDSFEYGELLREPRGEFLPGDARPQAHHGKDHAGVPGCAHGVCAVSRSSVRTVDAESVLRNVGVLFGARNPPGVRSGRRDHLQPAGRLRHEAPEGWPGDETGVYRVRELWQFGAGAGGFASADGAGGVGYGQGQSVLCEVHCESRLELFLWTWDYRAGGRYSRFESAE